MTTRSDILRADADRKGIPLRTLDDVKETIAERIRIKANPAKMASLMLRHGRLTDEARAWLASEYPQA
jgi:hypothetical protein